MAGGQMPPWTGRAQGALLQTRPVGARLRATGPKRRLQEHALRANKNTAAQPQPRNEPYARPAWSNTTQAGSGPPSTSPASYTAASASSHSRNLVTPQCNSERFG